MPDISHTWSQDLRLGPTGDILAVPDGTDLGRQRVIRRLLSAPGDLLFHPEYGAGLPSQIGMLLEAGVMEAMVRAQIASEAAVSQDPEPEIHVTPIPFGASVTVRYRDRDSGEAAGIGFDVTA